MASKYSYEIFEEVVKCGSFVSAAEKLNLSASAVSHMIKNMEDEFGFALFRRNRAGAELTENGRRISPYIHDLLTCEKHLLQEVSKINNHETGTVSIGLFSSVASNWFVKILSGFKEKYPDIDVVIYQGSYAKILRWLDQKEIDLAFTTDELSKGLNFMPLRTDPLICVTSNEFIPENKFSISVSDLKSNNLIINSECKLYDAQKFLAENKISVGTYYDIMEHQTLFAMVREGMGICVVPELVAVATPSDVKKYPIVGDPSRIIGLTLSDTKFVSPAASLLIDEIKHFINTL